MISTVAVLSDTHAILPAFERVLAEPALREAELIVVTGDHTWGPQPTQVLDRLTDLGDRVVLVDSRPECWADVFSGLPAEVSTVVCGHTHLPFVRLADRRRFKHAGRDRMA